jgi:hypothetical protein
MRALATLGGLALFGAHVAALPLLVDGCKKDELVVRLHGAPAAAAFDLVGEVPSSIASEVVYRIDGQPQHAVGPGLHFAQWSISYGGGFKRQVGAAQLVGPFQDPAKAPCGARLVVGQRLLDDGPGSVAVMVRQGIEEQMQGFEQFPVGEFEEVSKVEVTWTRFDDERDSPALFGRPHPDPATVFRQARRTDGYARIEVVVELTRLTATVVVAMVPMILDGQLDLAIYLHAEISTGISAIDWVIDKLPIDDYVSKTIKEQIDGALITAFEPPPPMDLPGGRTLSFSYCPDAYLAMRTDAWAGLPLAVHFEGGASDSPVLPPKLGNVPPALVTPDTSIAFDLDLDTLNAILYELWRTGFLDEQLAAAALDQRFAEDPTVRDLLTLRISPLRLALPPVVTPGPRGLRMAADLRLDLRDGESITPARAWGSLDVNLTGGPSDVGLAELELACEPEPGLLKPCYGDLVDAMRARAPDVRAELSGVLTKVLDDLFTGRRLAAPDQPAELVLGPPTTTSAPSGASATIRIAVDGKLEPVPL